MRRIGVLMLLAAALLFQGCLDLQVRMSIEKNWSGSLTFKAEMLDQLYAAALMQARQAGDDLFFLDQDALAAKLEDQGGRLRTFRNEVVDGMRVLEIEASFKDAKALVSGFGESQMRLEQTEAGWSLRMFDVEMNRATLTMGQEELEQMKTMMTPILGGMRWDIEIKTPAVVDTNLQRVDGRTVRSRMDFDVDIAEKRGKPGAEAFRNLMRPKYVTFTVD